MLAAIPMLYGGVAFYSYYSVLHTFGKVGSEDVVAEMARKTGKTIVMFPLEWGKWFIWALIWFVPLSVLWVLVNAAMHAMRKSVTLQSRWGVVLFLEILLVFLLFAVGFEPFSWYAGYVWD